MAVIVRRKCLVCDTKWTEKEDGHLNEEGTKSVLVHRFTMVGHSTDAVDVAHVCSTACASKML